MLICDNYKKLKAVLIVIALLFCFNGGYSQVSKRIDSLRRELHFAKDSIKFKVLYELFKANINIDRDSALHYADQSLSQAIEVGDSLMIVRAYLARGNMSREKSYFRQSLNDLKSGLEIAKRNGFRDQTMYHLNNIAITYTRMANYELALDYHLQSLRLREEEGNPVAISVALGNIGIVYQSLNDFKNAFEYHQRAYQLNMENGITFQNELHLINMGLSQQELGEYENALGSFNKALLTCGSDCSLDAQFYSYKGLGQVLQKIGRLDESEEQLKKALEVAQESGSGGLEATALGGLAELKLVRGQNEEAIALLDRSQQIIAGTDHKSELLTNYALYATVYTSIGQYEKALDFKQKYIDLNNEIFSGELIQKISRITTDYEERENIKTIAAKDQVLALQDEIIARQKQQYAFIITITFLTLGLAFVMYRANQSQRKINQELAKAKETIQRQNEMLSDANLQLESEVEERTRELVESNESLVKVNDEMDNFIYKTSHDIRGPLASLKGICNVAMMDVKDEAALDYLSKLDTSAAKLNAILSRLLIINQINHSILTPEKINFEEQVEEILELERKKELPERIDISYTIAPDLNFRSDKEMAKIILENLIDNAIKYHNDSERVNPFVRIEIGKERDWVCVKVIDNGIGIDEDSKDKIFQLFVRASERSDSGGIGLYLSKLATLKLGGDIYLSKLEEGYTVFKVLFPPDLAPVIERRKAEELRREKQKQKVLKVT